MQHYIKNSDERGRLYNKGRTIRKVKGGVGCSFLCLHFFQVVNRVCNFLMNMLHWMHTFYSTACDKTCCLGEVFSNAHRKTFVAIIL